MPRDPEKYRAFQVLLTDKELKALHAEANAREISGGELVRRALKFFYEHQEAELARILK